MRSFAIGNQSEIFPNLSSLFRIPILFNASKYVCRMVVWGLPVQRLLFSQQVSILPGMHVLDIQGILPNQCSCLLKTMSWIGSMPNLFSILVLLMWKSCTSHILILRIFLMQVVWNVCSFFQSDFFTAQVSHPQSSRFIGIAR